MSETMWYYKVGDKKVGPLSQSQLQKLFDDQILAPETLIWSDTLLDWIPSTMVDAFQIKIKKNSEDGSNIRPQQIRPWVRYWARIFDVYFFSFLAGFIFSFFSPNLSNTSDIILGMVIIFLWVFVESILLSTWGTTPGKWLLKATLRNNIGEKISFPNALRRSINVWWRGLGIGFPVATIITLLVAHTDLKKNGNTSWDRDGNFTVSHERVGTWRVILVILFFVFSLMLAFRGYVENSFLTRFPKKTLINNSLTELHLKGKIKSLRTISYTAIINNTEEKIKGERYGNESDLIFDYKGNKVEEFVYGLYGTLEYKCSFKHDSAGNEIEKIYYYKDGGLRRETRKYDTNGKVIEVLDSSEKDSLANAKLFERLPSGPNYDKSSEYWWGKTKSTYTYRYNETGMIVEQNEHIIPREWLKVCKFDRDGNVFESKLFLNGSFGEKHSYKYDGNRNEIEDTYFNSYDGGTTRYQSIYDFDKNDNWIRRIRLMDGKPTIITEREIEYY